MSKKHRRKLFISTLGTVLLITGSIASVFLSIYAYLSGQPMVYAPYVVVSIMYAVAGLEYRRIGMK